jgi:hypothetical protein
MSPLLWICASVCSEQGGTLVCCRGMEGKQPPHCIMLYHATQGLALPARPLSCTRHMQQQRTLPFAFVCCCVGWMDTSCVTHPQLRSQARVSRRRAAAVPRANEAVAAHRAHVMVQHA